MRVLQCRRQIPSDLAQASIIPDEQKLFISPMGILQFHKYFSFPLRCAGGIIVPSPLPLSLQQVL
jgi:hypothetical protein